MPTQRLAEQFDLPGVSDRTLTPLAGVFSMPPGRPQRRLVELLFEATRKLPKGKHVDE